MDLKGGYPVTGYAQPVKRYCQTLELKDDPKLIEEYKYWHKSENIFPEIPKGIREVGILNMEIFILGNRLLMIVETPVNFNWDQAFGNLAILERQAEWEELMSKYQTSGPCVASAEKWQLMERIFKLTNI